MLRNCIHCGDYIETELGEEGPGEHQDAQGTADDPKAPGDWDDVCAPCFYGLGLPSQDAENARR